MPTFDVDAVSALLNILEKALGHPRLKPLADAAQKQLEAVAESTAKQLEIEKAEEAAKQQEQQQAEVEVEPEPSNGDNATLQRRL